MPFFQHIVSLKVLFNTAGSETLAVNMFVESFQRNNQGYGAAIGVFLTLIILPITAIYMRATSSVYHAENK
jgi:multiple sugar transport system permease protein